MKQKLTFLILLIIPFYSISQVLESELKPEGITFPRVNTDQRNNLTPIQGQCIYNTESKNVECFDGTIWRASSENKIAFFGRSGPSYSPDDGEIVTVFNLRVYDEGNNFDGTNFTAPIDGLYHFDAALHFRKETTDIEEITGFVHIGSNFRTTSPFRIKVDSNREAINLSKTFYMQAGESVRLYFQVFTGGEGVHMESGGGSEPGGSQSYFSGFRVGGQTENLMNFGNESSSELHKISEQEAISNINEQTIISAKAYQIEEEIELLKNELEILREMVKELSELNGNMNSTSTGLINLSTPKLEQNIPNPFQNVTKIKYFLPKDSRNAKINIYDVSGKIMKEIKLESNGSGEIEIKIDTFSKGIFHYSLEIDGRIIDTKKMSSIK